MFNPVAAHLWNIILSGLLLTYGIFMILFLNDAKKCDKYLSLRDQRFRKAALIVTWVEVVLTGLSIIGSLIALAAGMRGRSYPMSAVEAGVPMSFY